MRSSFTEDDGPLIGVVGPTATGKSDLAMALAERVGGEIVSVDSAQVFRGLDVGTAKPTREEQTRVPHHLIDVIEPEEQWSAALYAEQAEAAVLAIRQRGRVPVLCGGTGLWLRALVRGVFQAPEIDEEIREAVRRELAERGSPSLHEELARVDPTSAARIHKNDPQRIGRALEVFRQTGTPISELQAAHGFREARFQLRALALRWDRSELGRRIQQRTDRMYREGLIEEVEAVLARGVSPDCPGLSIIGYRDVARHLGGELSLEEARAQTERDTRQYAKRQHNWFRSEPGVRWVEGTISLEDALEALRRDG